MLSSDAQDAKLLKGVCVSIHRCLHTQTHTLFFFPGSVLYTCNKTKQKSESRIQPGDLFSGNLSSDILFSPTSIHISIVNLTKAERIKEFKEMGLEPCFNFK